MRKEISRRAVLGGLAAVVTAAALGCSSDDNDNKDMIGPGIGNESTINNAYEGSNTTVSVDVSDPSGISYVKLLYRENGTTGTWTEVQLTPTAGDTYSATFAMPSSMRYDFMIETGDAKGNVSYSVQQTANSWATEANAETEVINKLSEFKTNADITDYFGPDYTIVLSDSSTVTVDALVLKSNFKAISYKGETDTDADITTLRTKLNNDFIPLTDVQAMIRSRVPTNMDLAKTSDWIDNTYVKHEKRKLEDRLTGVKLAAAGIGGLAALEYAASMAAEVEPEKECSRRGFFRGLGEKIRSIGKKLAAPAVLAAGVLAAREARADNGDEQSYYEQGKEVKVKRIYKDFRLAREEKRIFNEDVLEKTETTLYDRFSQVARIEETAVKGGSYQTNIYNLGSRLERNLAGVEEGIIQNGQNLRTKTQYFNVEQQGKLYNVIADHLKKTVEFKKAA